MKKNLCLAVLTGLSLVQSVAAQEAQVRVEIRTTRIGPFVYSANVSGRAADGLFDPTPSNLKPFLIAAQKALAEREGYSERLYGPDHHRLVSDMRVSEIRVTDRTTGRIAYSSRTQQESALPMAERGSRLAGFAPAVAPQRPSTDGTALGSMVPATSDQKMVARKRRGSRAR